MRQTNFEVGRQKPGYQTCYGEKFLKFKRVQQKTVDKDMKNDLEKSHWDHSRSWS